MIKLNNQQQQSIEAMQAFIEQHDKTFFSLIGPAGTGKTTTIQHLISALPSNTKICFTAPTNKAVRVLSKMTQAMKHSVPCLTIYSLLGLRVTLQGEKETIKSGGKSKLDEYQIVVIDEMSMINTELLQHIHSACRLSDTQIIFMGDKCQLPPIGEKESATFAIDNRSLLTKVMRQRNENPILGLCTDIRHLIEDGTNTYPTFNAAKNDAGDMGVHVMSGDMFNVWMPSAFSAENFDENYDRFRVIAWRNKTVNGYNERIQALRYPDLESPFSVGEPIIFSSPLHRISTIESYTQDTNIFSGWDEILCSTESEGVVTAIHKTDAFTYTLPSESITLNRYVITCRLLASETPEVTCIVTDNKPQLASLANKIANNIKNNAGLTWFNFWILKKYFADVRPAYAMTAHKSQGSTFENVFVDARDILANPNREEGLRCLYVAVSRASHNVILNV